MILQPDIQAHDMYVLLLSSVWGSSEWKEKQLLTEKCYNNFSKKINEFSKFTNKERESG